MTDIISVECKNLFSSRNIRTQTNVTDLNINRMRNYMFFTQFENKY